jgi:hypothetical protein
MYLAIGVLIGSTIMLRDFLILWRKANAIGIMTGEKAGCVVGITT